MRKEYDFSKGVRGKFYIQAKTIPSWFLGNNQDAVRIAQQTLAFWYKGEFWKAEAFVHVILL